MLVLVLGGAAALRLYQLDTASVWLDEAISWWAARLPWSELLPTLATHDESPPLYFALLHVWLTFGGSAGWMRLLSVVCSVATVGLALALGRLVAGTGAGVLAAVFVMLSPVQVHQAQEARMYALVAALTLAATYAALRTLGTVGWRWPLVWGLALAALAATHYTGGIVGAMLVAGAGGAAAARRVQAALALQGLPKFKVQSGGVAGGGPESRSGGCDRGRLTRIGVAVAVAVMAFLPVLPVFVAQSRLVAEHYWIPRPTPAFVVAELLGASVGTPPPAAHIQISDPLAFESAGHLVVALLAVPRLEPLRQVSLAISEHAWLVLPVLSVLVLGGLAAVWTRGGAGTALVLGSATLLPPLALLAASAAHPLFIARAMVGSGTLALVLVAAACVALPGRVRPAAVALVAGYLLLSLGEHWWYRGGEDWRAVAARLAEGSRPGDLVLINGRWTQLPLDYALRAHPGLGLEERGVPLDFGARGKPEPVTSPEDMPRVLALTAGRERVWLVLSHTSDTDPQGLTRKTLERELPCFDVWPLQGVSLLRFTHCAPGP